MDSAGGDRGHPRDASGGVWRSLAEFGGVWRSLAEFGGVWRSLAEFGGAAGAAGAAGVRDEGLLSSALMRPQNLFAYESPSLSRLAADYAYGLVKNPPFCDGNKRIAFTAALLFLEVNGKRVTVEEADAVVQTLALAAGELTEEAYSHWLDKNLS